MAVRYNTSSHQSFSKDLRICHHCLASFHYNHKLKVANLGNDSIDACNAEIHRIISSYHTEPEEAKKELQLLSQSALLDITEFDWLEADPSAAFWAWVYIRCYSQSSNQSNKLIINPLSFYGTFRSLLTMGNLGYQEMQLSQTPSSHSERMSLIIKFFDLMYINLMHPLNNLNQVMNEMKKQWGIVYKGRKSLNWLFDGNDKEECIEWAWNSLSEKFPFVFQLLYQNNSIRLTQWFIPLNTAERALALRAALDLWDNEPAEKTLFLQNLNKAWNQRKLRKSRTDKKALNVYLKNTTKEKLDKLAEQNEMRIGDFLEKLINDEYNLMNMK